MLDEWSLNAIKKLLIEMDFPIVDFRLFYISQKDDDQSDYDAFKYGLSADITYFHVLMYKKLPYYKYLSLYKQAVLIDLAFFGIKKLLSLQELHNAMKEHDYDLVMHHIKNAYPTFKRLEQLKLMLKDPS